MVGDSVTLESNTDIEGYDSIEWRSGNIRIARIKGVNGIFSTYYSDDWKFIDRLHLDNHTGSLTITNIMHEHSGVYELSIKVGNKVPTEIYSITVYVVNVSHVTLSWYKGNSLLSSISASNLSSSLFLPLEVKYQDKNNYSCVLKNPISNQTQHLDINDLNWLSSDTVNGCHTVEVVIRLVVTALMGVAAVAAIVVLVYDIKSRTGEKKTNIILRCRRIL
ncbi:CD48 antigen [Labeo rohita]|uniref:CD48 antigen n=1 Tax=Labeo rohita TaxID=84645 RepID=A0ABQ8L2P2_LABRO|nr:CD48 antigen [Labeo rohita]